MLNTMPQKAATYVHVKLYMAEVSAGNCAVVLATVYLSAKFECRTGICWDCSTNL